MARFATAAAFAVTTLSGCSAFSKPSPVEELEGHDEIVASANYNASAMDERLLKQRSTPAASTPPYRMGPGDEVTVTVIGEPELTGDHKLGPDGHIVMPLIGAVKISDITRADAAAKLQKRMDPFFESPRDVTVAITHYENNKVYVLGRVEKPGAFELVGAGNILQVIAQAGGLPVREFRSYLARAAIVRGRDEILWIDLVDLLQNANIKLNVPLQNGDIVYIPDSEDTIVFMMGEVEQPGAVPIKVRMNLMQALAQVGGPTDDADWDSVYLIRNPDNGGPPRPVRINLNSIIKHSDFTQNYWLKAGDIVYVARSGIADINYFLSRLQPATTPVIIYSILRE